MASVKGMTAQASRGPLVALDLAVPDVDGAVGVVGDVLLVGDEDDRVAVAAWRRSKRRMISSPGGGVEVAGGLVGEQDRGLHHQGAGDGHALALAARELVGLVASCGRRGRPCPGPAGPAPAARPWGSPA